MFFLQKHALQAALPYDPPKGSFDSSSREECIENYFLLKINQPGLGGSRKTKLFIELVKKCLRCFPEIRCAGKHSFGDTQSFASSVATSPPQAR